MRDQELVNALREHAEWAQANEWETPITLGDDLVEAADRIANQSTHIAALQQEIEKLRGQVPRWIPVEENLFPGGANLAGGCGGGNPRQAIVYVTNPDAPRNCCAGGFGSTKIGEEAE